jgi:hypothetical protein
MRAGSECSFKTHLLCCMHLRDGRDVVRVTQRLMCALLQDSVQPYVHASHASHAATAPVLCAAQLLREPHRVMRVPKKWEKEPPKSGTTPYANGAAGMVTSAPSASVEEAVGRAVPSCNSLSWRRRDSTCHPSREKKRKKEKLPS